MLDLSVKEISHDHNTSCHECFCALAKNDPQDHFCLRRALAAYGLTRSPSNPFTPLLLVILNIRGYP